MSTELEQKGLAGIPAHWALKSLRHMGELVLGLTYSPSDVMPDDTGIRVLRASNIFGGKLVSADDLYVDTDIPDNLRLKAGDVLICSRSGSRNLIGKNALVPHEFEGDTFGAFMTVLRSQQSRYLQHVLSSDIFFYQSHSSMTSTINQLTLGMLKEIVVPCPPPEEQHRIADFLDERTARIDGLIARKQRLLALLAEKRQALITRAVTKGLDPNAPMKPSGIDWLGDVPAHWEIKRLKYTVSAPLKYGANAAAEFDVQDWPRFVRITDIDENGGLRDDTFRSLPPEIASGYILESEDILLARSGATVGKSFVYRYDWGSACFAGYLIRYRVHQDYCTSFFSWFLNSRAYWEWISANLIQATIQNVSADRYGNLRMPVPPYNEQEKIAAHATYKVDELDQIAAKVKSSIRCLQEYRAALITAAVTGQLEVPHGEAHRSSLRDGH